jgi:hypothetical protein
MRGFECLRDLLRDPERLVDRHLAACDPLSETLAVHQFQHEELRTLRFVKP